MNKTTSVLFGVTLATLATAYWLLQGPATGPGFQMPTPQVSVIPAKRDTVIVRAEAVGTLQAWESISLTAPISETVAQIHFQEGQEVSKGDLLVVLDQAEEKARLAQAQANLQEQEREVRRLEALVASRSVPQTQLDERLTLREKARFEVAEIQAQLQDRTLRAPFSGTIGLKEVSTGALVRPGDRITTLDDLSNLRLDFSVPARYLAALRVGLKIEAHAPGFAQPFIGNVTAIDSRINPTDRSIRVRAQLPNPDHQLKPGLLMNVELQVEERQGIVVPEQALISLQASHYLLLVPQQGEPIVERRAVELGVRRPGIVEIRSGLDEGEQVIIEGIDQARPGQPAQVRPRLPQEG